MVADDHQVAHVIAEVRSAGGVGHKQGPDPDLHHHADGEDHLGHLVPLVIVDAPLHGDDAFPAESADDEIALVADGGGDGESRDVAVGDGEGLFDFVGQFAKAAAQDDAHFGLPRDDPGTQVVGGGIDYFR